MKGKGVGAVIGQAIVGRRYFEERLGIRGEIGRDKVLFSLQWVEPPM